jgi:hypothetical protein
MGILELHFHDSEFSWSVSPGTGTERSLSLKTGSKSGGKSSRKSSRSAGSSGGGTSPSAKSKLGSLAVLGLVVGAGIVFNRLRARRARAAAEAESKSPGRRLSLFRGK